MNRKQIRAIAVTCTLFGFIAAPALAASATSNVVGVVAVVVPPRGNYTVVGLNFSAPNGDGISLKDLLDGQIVRDNRVSNATRIHLWNPTSGVSGGYVSVYQRSNGVFCKIGDTTNTPINLTVNRGDAFWIQSPSNATQPSVIFLKGQVIGSPNIIRSNPANLSMFANPYAAPLELNNSQHVEWNNATAHNRPGNADKVHIWTANGFASYYLRGDRVWTNMADSSDTSPVIQVGGGAWYEAKKQFNNLLSRPYPWE